MNDKLLLVPGTSLENLHALRDALTDALNSLQSPVTTRSEESCIGNALTSTCQSTLSYNNAPVLSKRKLRFKPGPAGLNVRLFSNRTYKTMICIIMYIWSLYNLKELNNSTQPEYF